MLNQPLQEMISTWVERVQVPQMQAFRGRIGYDPHNLALDLGRYRPTLPTDSVAVLPLTEALLRGPQVIRHVHDCPAIIVDTYVPPPPLAPESDDSGILSLPGSDLEPSALALVLSLNDVEESLGEKSTLGVAVSGKVHASVSV